MRRVAQALAVGLAVVAAAGCGGGSDGTPAAESTTASATETRPPTATTELAVYFLRGGKVGTAGREVPQTQAVGRAALDQLVEGPNAAEREAGLSTAVPAGTELAGLKIADGEATVDGLDGLPRAARAQVVYTLTQFPTVKRVNGLTRADFETETPPILVEHPAVGETVSSPIHLSGTANTYEAEFRLSVVDGSGRLVDERVMATSGSGERGTFDVSVPYTAKIPGPGAVIAYEINAADGSRFHVVSIPLTLR